MPVKKKEVSGEKPVEIEPEAETVEAEEPSSVEMTEEVIEDLPPQQEKVVEIPQAKPVTREEELKIWIEASKKNSVEIPQAKPVAREEDLKAWVEASKKHDAEVLKKKEEDEEVRIELLTKSIEEKVSEDFPNSYRVTDWAGHPNYECNKCGFADLDKFKLYAHLIQTHSGIEYDYRGETTHT